MEPNGEYWRLQAYISSDVVFAMRGIMSYAGITGTELVRHAITVNNFAHDVEMNGGHLWVAKDAQYDQVDLRRPLDAVYRPVKLGVNLNGPTMQAILRMSATDGLSYGETTNRSVLLYNQLLTEVTAGAEVYAVNNAEATQIKLFLDAPVQTPLIKDLYAE
ncbi:MAG: hypothetical protein JWN38_1154 [Candidatus Saccharibacteria bacterium]|nr:hypothetical protein [Candidatus Saccharibacteria bacterium]